MFAWVIAHIGRVAWTQRQIDIVLTMVGFGAALGLGMYLAYRRGMRGYEAHRGYELGLAHVEGWLGRLGPR